MFFMMSDPHPLQLWVLVCSQELLLFCCVHREPLLLSFLLR
jgi:hypothetical protein